MEPACRGIITDWGGVLTGPLRESIEAWLHADGIDVEAYRGVMSSWVSQAYGSETAGDNPIHALERGEVEPSRFERLLAAELRLVDGGEVPPEGLLSRMFAAFTPVEEMYALLRQARSQGVRTCLLSNSWGNSYPRETFADTFDAVVISSEVGMRKPEPEIFHHATELLGLPAHACVFVDDIEPNVAAARELGMRAILHQGPEQTRRQLEEACGVELSPVH